TRTPLTPQERNPRVPVALNEVCMRMLEKEPQARLADMDAVAAALQEALAGAGADWDMPLMDPFAPEVLTTEEIPGQVVDRDTWERFQQQLKAVMPRRGRVRKKARSEPPPQAPAAAAVAVPQEEAPAGSFVALAEAVEARLDAPPLPVSAHKAAAPKPAPEARHDAGAGHGAVAALPPVRRSGRGRPARTAAAAVALLLVLAGTWALHSRLESRGARSSAPAAPVVPAPARWWASNPTLHAALVREVAEPGEPSEAERSAAASPDPSPALTSMFRENDTRSKPDENSAARSPRKALHGVPGRQEMCVVGFCTVLLTGCTGTSQVVRPPPRPADCPPGAVEAMKELGIDIGEVGRVSFGETDKPEGRLLKTVRESTPMEVLELDGLGNYELTGRLYLGPERVYGRFTQARGRRSGKTYPVCLELVSRRDETLGAYREDVGGPTDSALVITTQRVRAVERFE
ncbi:MAG TPA: hypothetical protein VEU33_04435, partial [Archangium sp.]|nr:hypothetical protein [Archangium sp.]